MATRSSNSRKRKGSQPFSTGDFTYKVLAEDHSGNYLYGGGSTYGSNCTYSLCPDAVGSFAIGSNGTLTQETQTGLSYGSGPGILAIATSR